MPNSLQPDEKVPQPASAQDVFQAYCLFLGRDPDAEATFQQKVGLSLFDLIREFVGSAEFLVRVRDRILALERPASGRFDAPPDSSLCRWAATRLPLEERTKALVGRAVDWIELYEVVFSDETFRAWLGPSPTLRPPFLDHLRALLKASLSKSSSSVPTWVLVTGAPRSGTGLLRAMLAQHQCVALLKEYGLTRLVDQIDAIVSRPAIQDIDWSAMEDASDSRLARLAAFYRDHPGRRTDRTEDGQFRRGDFDAVALGIFSALSPGKVLRVIGDKMPMSGDWEDVPRLVTRLNRLKLVVVIRNPADVVASSLIRRAATTYGRDDWPIRSVHDAVVQWIGAWHATSKLKQQYPDAVHVLKYEDLCADPRRTMAEVDAFLGLAEHAPDLDVAVRPPEMTVMEPSEKRILAAHLGAVIEAWPSSRPDELMRVFARLPPPYKFDTTIELERRDAEPFLVSGFSGAEPGGRWIRSSWALITLSHGETTGLLLIELWIAQVAVGQDGRRDVVVRVDLCAPRLFTLGANGGRVALAVRAGCGVQGNGTLTIDIKVAGLERPEGGEMRAPAICVQRLRVTHLASKLSAEHVA